jgi:protein SCO1/2
MRYFFLTLFCGLLLSSCQKAPPPDVVKEFQLHGDVVGIDRAHHTAMIKAEAIPGWMEAMTMEYPVKVSTEMDKLRPGAHIQASVYQHQSTLEYWIGNVHLVPPPSPAEPGKAAGSGAKDVPGQQAH